MSRFQLRDELLGNGNTKRYKLHPDGMAFSSGMDRAEGGHDPRETQDELCELLAKLSRTDKLVRVFYGDADGQSWLDENDIAGRVGRSTGSLKVPLLVPPDCDGGGAMLDSYIIRLDVQTGRKHTTVWQHPKFHLPELILKVGDLLELPYEVWSKSFNTCYGRFFTRSDRERWLDLITGKRFPDWLDFENWATEEAYPL